VANGPAKPERARQARPCERAPARARRGACRRPGDGPLREAQAAPAAPRDRQRCDYTATNIMRRLPGTAGRSGRGSTQLRWRRAAVFLWAMIAWRGVGGPVGSASWLSTGPRATAWWTRGRGAGSVRSPNSGETGPRRLQPAGQCFCRAWARVRTRDDAYSTRAAPATRHGAGHPCLQRPADRSIAQSRGPAWRPHRHGNQPLGTAERRTKNDWPSPIAQLATRGRCRWRL
jgi:hypothetical protein